jgi:hypothetical protein
MTRGRPDFALEFDPITLQMKSCLGWSRADLERTMERLTEACIARGGSYTVQRLGSIEPCELFAGTDDRNYCGSTSSSWYFPGPHRTRTPRANRDFLPDGRFRTLVEAPPPAPRRLPIVAATSVKETLSFDRRGAEAALAEISVGRWSILDASPIPEGLLIRVRTPIGELSVTAEKNDVARPHYLLKRDIAYSYRNPVNGSLDAERLRVLDRFLDALDRYLA